MPSHALVDTLSALIAALGSAITLLSAFALYRLQTLTGELDADALRINDTVGGWADEKGKDKLIILAGARRWSEYLKQLKTVRKLRGDEAAGVNGRTWMARLETNCNARRDLLVGLWVALGLTGLVMAAGLAALAGVEPIACLPAWPAVLGFLLCLVSYYALIRTSLR
jgi:hypothetical protein